MAPRSFLSAVLLIAALGVRSGCAAEAGALDREFTYAAGLVQLGLPDLAVEVADRLARENPDQKDRAEVIRAEAFIAARKFADAEAIVAALPKDSPKAQAIRLALADGFFQANDLDRCRLLYDEFFSQYAQQVPSDPDLLRFYRDAAYKFAQMLAYRGDYAGAVVKYDLLLAASPDPTTVRQIRSELAEMCLRAARAVKESATGGDPSGYLNKAEAECREVLWGGTDVWFGRAITSLAQLAVARARPEDATALLQDNLRILKKLDELLEKSDIPMSESPLAGARHLLGSLYKEEADLLMGAEDARQNEALKSFEKYLGELERVWNLIVLIHQRDDANVKRYGASAGVLAGTAAQRRKPFDDAAAALRTFQETVAAAAPAAGWAAGAADRAGKLKQRTQELIDGAGKYPKDLGVTPVTEMEIGEDFRGKPYLARARLFLAGEPARKQEAVAVYSKALREFYAVFIGYPKTEWSKVAGEQVALVKDLLKGLTGQNVQIEMKEGGQRKLGLAMLSEGQELFGRKEYDKAIPQLLKGLNVYPEGSDAVVALQSLMECGVALKDAVRVKMLAEYIAERFRGDESAPQILLRTARLYFEENNPAMYGRLYDLYLKHFPSHASAPMILFMLGEQRWKAADYAGAVPYYDRVVAGYPSTHYFTLSLDRVGWCWYKRGEFAKAIEAFGRVARAPLPGKEKAQGKLCLADSHLQMNRYAEALDHYRELAAWLEEKDSIYARSQEARNEFRALLEQAVFFQAYCLGQMKEPADKLPEFQQSAVDLYRQFIERFTSSTLAPTALSSLGALLLTMNRSDEAAKAFDELATRFPDSDAGQNARFAMIRSLVGINQIGQAQAALEEVLREADRYPAEDFLRLGALMLEKSQPQSAALTLEAAAKRLKDTAAQAKDAAGLEQRLLMGLGEAYFQTQQYDKSAASLADLIQRFPTSAMFYDARFLMARALRESGQVDAAMKALREIFERAGDQNLINRATLELAPLQLVKGDADGALASYQRIVLLMNPDDPKTAPLYEEAIWQSVALLGKKEAWAAVIENCDRYVQRFPAGRWINEVREWRTQAGVNTAGKGGGQ